MNRARRTLKLALALYIATGIASASAFAQSKSPAKSTHEAVAVRAPQPKAIDYDKLTQEATDLLSKYWPKLVRSYASEAVVTRAKEMDVTTKQADAFLADMEGRREMSWPRPGS